MKVFSFVEFPEMEEPTEVHEMEGELFAVPSLMQPSLDAAIREVSYGQYFPHYNGFLKALSDKLGGDFVMSDEEEDSEEEEDGLIY